VLLEPKGWVLSIRDELPFAQPNGLWDPSPNTDSRSTQIRDVAVQLRPALAVLVHGVKSLRGTHDAPSAGFRLSAILWLQPAREAHARVVEFPAASDTYRREGDILFAAIFVAVPAVVSARGARMTSES